MKQKIFKKSAYCVLALFLAATTVWSCSIMGAYATTDAPADNAPICGFVAHTHTQESCYTATSTLTCTLVEDDTHTHVGTCYEYADELVCTLAEAESHAHGDTCYTTTTTLSCGKEETAGHTHGEGCYETVTTQVCGKEAHVHDASCRTEKKNLICTQTEVEAHTHGDGCYLVEESLTCTTAESDGHKHGETCYESVLTCTNTEEGHVHDAACHTKTETLICTQTEHDAHKHGEGCYTKTTTTTLNCGKEETAGHTHGEGCYETITEQSCGKEVHEHDSSCQKAEEKLICQQAETAAHTHDTSCNTETRTLSCGKEETAGHAHGTGCYEQRPTLICNIHVHTEDCYSAKTELTCTLLEHVHGEGCYKSCTCTPVDGVHQEGCALYVAVEKCEHCGVELTENTVHAKGCLTYCTCTPADGVHAENCMTHCTCEPENGVHGKTCALYKETTIQSSFGVTVFGALPETAELAVEPLAEADLTDFTLEANKHIVFAYDISILVDGAEYQPDGTVEVTVPMQAEAPDDGFDWKLVVQHIDNGLVESVPCRDNGDGTATFWADGFSTYVGTIALDGATTVEPVNGQIIFDLYYGSVALTDDAFAGYNTNGDLITGVHDENTRYIIQQSEASTPTTNTISVGMYDLDVTLPTSDKGAGRFSYINSVTSTPVRRNFLIELAGVNIRAADQVSAFSVNNKGESVVAVILKDGTTNYLYSGINRAGLEKSGGATSDGTLVLTCEAGYTAWLADPNAGHTDSNHFSACSDTVCGMIDARSGNAWYNSDNKNSYYGGAGIGTHGSGSGGSSTESNRAGDNALVNLTIAGGNIFALGARGNQKSTSSGGGANIGTGSASTSGVTAGTINGLKITGGTIQLWRGDHSAACIGGGYRSGYVNMEIYGGTILTRDQANSSYTTLTKINKVRASGIGGGGGGSNSNSPAGATVTIYGGQITTSSQYGAAIGSGAGGDGAGSHTGNASEGIINIHGGTIYATTTAGAGSGAGAAIGAGGSLAAGKAGNATVNIYGGTIVASSALGADIGGGGTNSTETTGIGGDGTVTITGGTIIAMSGGIGGGRANAGIGGDADVTITGGTITAAGVGGGDSKKSDGGNCTLEISGGTVTVNNQTGVSIGGGNGGTGGNGGNATLLVSGDAVLYAGSIGGGSTLNESGSIGSANVTISGGYIQGQVVMAAGAETACSFKMTDGTLDNRYRVADGFYFVKEDGGAVYMDDPNGVATMSGGTIQNCSTENGGAVYMTAGEFTLTGDGVIEDCSADRLGGAVYLGGGTMRVSGGTITDNIADYGGGVYLGGGDMIISGGTITKNAADYGGGAYVSNGTLRVSGGNIDYNTADEDGGGAYVSGGELNISGGALSRNTARFNGGGACVENGTVIMSGGKVEQNTATYGNGGGMYVSADGQDVVVTIYSGSVSGNSAGASGGAVAVVGNERGSEVISVTLGVNEDHTYVPFTHVEASGTYEHKSCPEISGNFSSGSGGAIYIYGGETTQLNMFCLSAEDNEAEGGDSLSNFMMVEGGTVVMSTSEQMNDETSDADDNRHGLAKITGTVHVLGGDVSLYGTTSNPLLEDAITVDVVGTGGSFNDYRYSDEFYKLLYFENFMDPDGNVTGQYTAYQIPKDNNEIEISGVIYSHIGYEIVGWYTNPTMDGNGSWYNVGDTYELDDDLTIYAIWEAHGYTIEFNPNVPLGEAYSGTMEPQTFVYNTADDLNPNVYKYPGHIFTGWKDDKDKVYKDEAQILNLTTKDGEVITLYAQWVECEHNGSYGTSYTYSADSTGTILCRKCSCEGQTLYATLSAEDTVYDNVSHPAKAVYTDESVWKPDVVYTKEADAGFSGIPTDAGTYTASVTDGGVTISVTYTIAKAEQDPPNTPTFTVSDNVLTVDPVAASSKVGIDPAIKTYYQLFYFFGGDAGSTAPQESNQFTFAQAYTSYYVKVWYGEGDNHNKSSSVRSEQTYFYNDGKTKITFDVKEGILCSVVENTDGDGLLISVAPDEGYYLTSDFSVTKTPDSDPPVINIQEVRKTYLLQKIPDTDGLEIRVTISGAARLPTMTAKVTEKQVFGTVNGTSATISQDSAFTAYYAVSNYDSTAYSALKLTFSSAVPAGTTVIMLDKTDGSYWYYNAGSDTTEVLLPTLTGQYVSATFTRMGGSDSFVVSGANLAYQFIVDFSRTAAGFSGSDLTMSLSGIKANDAAPDLSAAVAVTLKAQGNFSMTTKGEGQAQTIALTYTPSDGTESKWGNRKTALLLTPVGDIPPDATLQVTSQSGAITSWPRRDNGTFIIPLSTVGSETLSVKLDSSLFPTEQTKYQFTVQWIVSNSETAKAPMNGLTAAPASGTVSVTFQTATEIAPSMTVTGNKRLLSITETLSVQGNVILPTSGCTVTAELLRKDDATGIYNSTAGRPTVTVAASNTFNCSVPLSAYTPGSFCLMLTMKHGVDAILQVPYYFIVE